MWREANYAGVTPTSRQLLYHWFSRSHAVEGADGEETQFGYYFCQREAIETLIYLYEVRGIRTISGLIATYGGAEDDTAEQKRALSGVNPDDDVWPRYAMKMATGSGKTKVMSLAIVWSYFHALRESDSPMTTNFLLLAPGLTVFERLKEDFRADDGGPNIFDRDPLIPSEWRGDWHMTVVLQDEPAPPTSGGVLYLSNIHRLFESRTRAVRSDSMYDWVGPKVEKTKALKDPITELRDRVAAHRSVMVLNDEAHHVWDPGSAWNVALKALSESCRDRGGEVVAQLDFSATPKDDKGQVFMHVVCDTPLGEAVDAGIVKTPVIGHGDRLVVQSHSDAAFQYEHHLVVGYRKWLDSHDEWQKSGKQPLLFVMTESTQAADQIAHRLNSDPMFVELNGRTLNLHTNLKGRLVKKGRGGGAGEEFVESETSITDDDLRALRKLSRDLDRSTSPYRCIVSVLMLREGWDVKNVTTIVPLRPLSAKSKILPEQTLGRGLRRMTPPADGVAEMVTVIEHKAFSTLYGDELSREGLPLTVVDVERIPRTTVTIFPDPGRDLPGLDIEIPQLLPGYRLEATIVDLSFEDVATAFARYLPLPLGRSRPQEIDYEGRHLITDEIVDQMRIKLPLLSDGIGAISFFREELERATKVRNAHPVLAPLLQRFLEELLFEPNATLFDSALVARLGDTDVRELIRAVFVPLIRSRITYKQARAREAAPRSVTTWKPFQVTHSETKPAELAVRTPFNLVPCDRQLEVAMAHYLDRCDDVTAFAKNAGPQKLTIDCLNSDGRRSFYWPDFIVRKTDGGYLLVETKGRADRDVGAKASAAVEWCKAASNANRKWTYVYAQQAVFERLTGSTAEELVRACAPSLISIIDAASTPQMQLDLGTSERTHEGVAEGRFIESASYTLLPTRYQRAIDDAVALFGFQSRKTGASLAPIFQPLLGPIDNAAENVVVSYLASDVPSDPAELDRFFVVQPAPADKADRFDWLLDRGKQLRKLLVHRAPLMPIGLLVFCLDYAHGTIQVRGGVLDSVGERFADLAKSELRARLQHIYDFRNTYIAHQKRELVSVAEAEGALVEWIRVLVELHAAAVVLT